MPSKTIPAAATSLPFEPAFEASEVGVMFLLLQTIVDRLHVEGGVASFELTPDLADELAAFGAANEDAEDDDPLEESEAAEESDQLETDCRLEAYVPVEMKPTRRV